MALPASRRRLPLLLVAAAACHDSPPTAPTAPTAARAGLHDAAAAAAAAAAATPDLPALARAIPGFGGLLLDEQGRPTVYLTDPAERPLAEAALEPFLRARGLAPDRLRVRRAAFTYAQLEGWYDAALPRLLALPGVVMADLDEGRNRLYVGVRDGSAARAAAAVFARVGVPPGAWATRTMGPLRQHAALTDHMRPTQAGIVVEGKLACTLGFNAESRRARETVRLLVTAAHCTNTQGDVAVKTAFAQPNALAPKDRNIALELTDPAFFARATDARCPADGMCRYSDAASARYTRSTKSTLGRIARTTGENDGSVQIDAANPTFTIVADAAGTIARGTGTVNDVVHFVGKTSGWVSGKILHVCAPIGAAVSDKHWLLCQTLVSARSQGGDSGAPVFIRGATGVTLFGIVVGTAEAQRPDGTIEYFLTVSPIANIRHELGALVTH